MKNIIQENYLNNRYYLDNSLNFLILRDLWISQPKQYARILKKKRPNRTRGLDSYLKYHPIFEWVNDMAKKYMINYKQLSLLDKVKFILKDLIDFPKKHKLLHNIYDIYPDTNLTDSTLKNIKKIINDNPMNWAWLLSNVKKYKLLLKYINDHTPKLQHSNYSLLEKIKWILEGLTDFPKCANPNCTNILYHIKSRNLTEPIVRFCSQKCVQESKQHKPHSFFNKRKYKKCYKHLDSLEESKNSKYKIEYFNIVNFYIKLNLKKVRKSKYLLDLSKYVEKHHINPRWYFISNCVPIIDYNNIVIVPYHIHVKLHILLAYHYKSIKDKRNYYKAIRACLAFYNPLKSKIRNLIQLPNNLKNQLEKLRLEYKKIQGLYSKSKKVVINITTNQLEIVPYSKINDNFHETLYVQI